MSAHSRINNDLELQLWRIEYVLGSAEFGLS